MKILIDLQGAQTSSRFRGIGRYSLDFVKALLINPREHDISLLLNGMLEDSIEDIRYELSGLIPNDNIYIFEGVAPSSYSNSQNEWRRATSELIREFFVRKINPDFLLLTSVFEGFADNYVPHKFRANTSIPVASIFYDLIPYLNPDDYLHNQSYRDWYFDCLDNLKGIKFLLSISSASMEEAIEHLNIPRDQIANISSAVASGYHDIPPSSEVASKKILESFGIFSPYLLYVSATDVRKNHFRLIEAYSRLSKAIRNTHQLVFAGGMPPNTRLAFYKFAKRHGLGVDELIFTDGIDDGTLKILYSSCKAFIFPSWHEGFGLPLLEAMHFNKAIIGSNRSSIPEILHLESALFNPFDVDDISRKIERVLTDLSFRELLENNSKSRKKLFTWDKSVETAFSAMVAWIDRHSDNSIGNLSESYNKKRELNQLIAKVAELEYFHSEQDLVTASASISLNSFHIPLRQLLVDVSVLVEHDSKTGIQRVVRNILRQWLTNPPAGYLVRPVYADMNQPYRYATRFVEEFYSGRGTLNALDDDVVEFAPGDVFIGLDLLYPFLAEMHKPFYRKMRNHGVIVKFVVYDLLPILLPQHVVKGAEKGHSQWLKIIAQSDGAICISKSVAQELSDWLKNEGVNTSKLFKIDWFHLASEGEARTSSSVKDCLQDDHILKKVVSKPSFLSVGTIEPRKGYSQILTSFEMLWSKGIDVNLVIIGKKGWMVSDLINKIQSHQEFDKRLFWLEDCNDERLELFYKSCSCFIAASEGEGFGLPLIEAANRGIPIIARDLPVFREVAGDNAYYFKGVMPFHLAEAVQEWIMLDRGDERLNSLKINSLTWKQSSEQLFRALVGV